MSPELLYKVISMKSTKYMHCKKNSTSYNLFQATGLYEKKCRNASLLLDFSSPGLCTFELAINTWNDKHTFLISIEYWQFHVSFALSMKVN